MSRPCVCGGSNESCRYCNGRGEIPDALANALTIRSQRPEAQKVRPGARRKRKLTKWDTARRPDASSLGSQPTRFKRLSRRSSSRQLPSDSSTSAGSDVTLCRPDSEAHVASHKIDDHIKKAHIPTPRRQELGVKSSLSDSRTEYTHCPVCSDRVKPQNLERHLRKVHHRRSKKHLSVPGLVPSDVDVNRRSTTLIAPRDKNLDATKLYAQSYREHGRFGSHPSHDGFDDESHAD